MPCAADCGTSTFPYPLDWASCPTGNACYAGGTYFMASHTGFAAGVLTMTGRGRPWTLVRSGSLGFSPDNAVCPHPGHCLGVLSTSPFDPGTTVFRTDDGGLKWQRHAAGSSRIRNAIACTGTYGCVTVGNQGSITESAGGYTFIRDRSPISRNLFGVTCVAMSICYAVGNFGTIVKRSPRR